MSSLLIFNSIKCLETCLHIIPHFLEDSRPDVLPAPTADLESDFPLYLEGDCPIHHERCPDDLVVVERTRSDNKRDAYDSTYPAALLPPTDEAHCSRSL